MEKMTERVVREQLVLAMQQGYLVEVHNLPGDDYFNVGFVVGIDPTFCLLISIDWDGKINGLIVIRISSIMAIIKGSDYLTTVSEKTKVAHRYHYFDIWQVQRFLDDHPEITSGNLLGNALADAYDHHLPVVVGTQKYKGNDDFIGHIVQLESFTTSTNTIFRLFGNIKSSWLKSTTCVSGERRWPPVSRSSGIFFQKNNCNGP